MKLKKILLILSCLLAQDDIDISKFYTPPSMNPIITFDNLNNSAYYFNSYYPYALLEDYQILDIRINGSHFSPLGTYMMKPLYKNIQSDSLLSNEFEHKQGDYGYYENSIIINQNDNNLSSFFMAQGRTQPKYYTSGTDGIFKPGIPIGVIETDEEVFVLKFFSDLNQLYLVNVVIEEVKDN